VPIGFKRPIDVIFYVATPSGSLVEVGSGNSAAGNVAVDKFEGNGTGYSNYFTPFTASAQFTPGVAKRYSLSAAGYVFLGDCSIKLESKYADLVAAGSHLKIGSVEWNYKQISERGAGFGNDRIVLALTRRKDA